MKLRSFRLDECLDGNVVGDVVSRRAPRKKQERGHEEQAVNSKHTFSLYFVSLLRDVAGRQDLMRIDAHNQVDDFVRGDFAEPMRRVRRNDDDVTGADFAAHAILDATTFGAGAVQQGDHFIAWRDFLGITECAAGDERAVAGDDVINLGDLAVLDAGGGLFAGRLEPADDTDANVIFAGNVDDANGLIADSHSGHLAHHGFDFGVTDIGGRTAGKMRRRVLHLGAESAGNRESKNERKSKKTQHYFLHRFLL